MKLHFFKMQAQGNDYIYLDFLTNKLPDLDYSELAIKLSDRHKGIGSDGIVLLLPDTSSDVFMRIFNSNGSEAKSCGSALRSITQYFCQLTRRKNLTINTLSGIKHGEINSEGIPRICLGETSILRSDYKLGIYQGDIVNLGNSHFVIFTEVLPKSHTLSEVYDLCLKNEATANSNLEMAKIVSPHEIELLIWERGSGATLACGTGAGAAVFSGINSSYLKSPVKVNMPGGDVIVEFKDNNLSLVGEVEFVYSGIVDV